ncbi:MAG: hypothetical protein U0667_06085 [Chloroflexota bacterium]
MPSEQGRPGSTDDHGTRADTSELVADHIESIGLVRGNQVQREELLERVGDRGPVEQDIVDQVREGHLAILRDVAAFPAAHRATMRSLEVLERNAGRPPAIRGLGPLTPIAVAVVAALTRAIARNYVMMLIGRIQALYLFRVAGAPLGSPERAELRRASRDVQAVSAELRGGGRGVLALIAGGVVVSTLASVALPSPAPRREIEAVLAAVVLVGGLLAFSWCCLMGAAAARRRIRLSVEVEARQLFEAIGGCGAPPRDHAVEFALGLATMPMPVACILALTGSSPSPWRAGSGRDACASTAPRV